MAAVLRRRLGQRLLSTGRSGSALVQLSNELARPRPEEYVLVRHGESEGNVAFNRSVEGDHSLYAGEFLERHSSFWRLTDRGRAQARKTGEWINANLDMRFDGFFSSEYLRAMETAALLSLPDARWKTDVMLRERDWGEYDLASQEERRSAFRRYEARRRRESLFWAPPGGESLAQVVQRVDSVLLFENRRYSGGRVIHVCHGELMWAFRLRFERLSQITFREMQRDPQVHDRVHNCQVLQYSRRCPESAKLFPDFRFMRSVCPWDLSLSTNEWQHIDRSGGLSDAEMLTEVEQFPRMYNDDGVDELNPAPGDPEQGLSCAGGLADPPKGGAADAEVAMVQSRPRTASGSQTRRRALLLTKTARWRMVTENPAADGDGVGGGRNAAQTIVADATRRCRDALKAACEAHEKAVESARHAIKAAGYEVRSQDARGDVCPSDLEWADLCVALGGDGTMLRAAHVATAGMLVLGVNTDPTRSVGHHCAVSIGPEKPVADAEAMTSMLSSNDFAEVRVPRMRVTFDVLEGVTGSDGDDDGNAGVGGLDEQGDGVLHAVNECFVGESDPSRPIEIMLSVDDGPWSRWRCSGAIISTQGGSTAWMQNATALTDKQVATVLSSAAQLGAIGLTDKPRQSGGDPPAAAAAAPPPAASPSELRAIAAAASTALVQHDDRHLLQFLVREGTPWGAVGGAANLEGGARHGLGRRVRMRPSGWQTIASVDGLPPTRLPRNCVVTFQIEPDEGLWLRTIEATKIKHAA
jgi:NAD+ kinase